jgi:membrane associated rhomboid family serine protease
MGLYDRDYTQENFRSAYDRPQTRFASGITPVVKWLLIINVAVFLVSFLITPVGKFFFYWFSVYPATLGMSLQFWRLITYQFLHSTSGFGHIFWNMLILFFFGPMLERLWGSRKFLVFYLVCGAAGGVLYPLLALAGWLRVAPLIGASGAILGMLAAGAILFPNMRVLVMFIFPVRLRIVAVILALVSILTLLRPEQFENAGGEAAHLAGMAAGAIYVFSQGWRERFKLKIQSGRWEKKITAQRSLQAELDRILQKVHDSGIQSLTPKEKKLLRQATEAEQRRNKL